MCADGQQGWGEERAGPRAPVSTSDQRPGWAARRLSRGAAWGEGFPRDPPEAGPHRVSTSRQRLQIETFCLEQQRRASQRRSIAEPL